MQCGLVARNLSAYLPVCPSVCLSSNAWIVTKLKKNLSNFCQTKDHLAWFSEKKNGWWGATSLEKKSATKFLYVKTLSDKVVRLA